MLSGFNTNFRYRGVLFHVQTEDSGLENPHVITHLFHGGNIMASQKSDYSTLLEQEEGIEAGIRKIMEGQHKTMLKQLSRGEHDVVISQRLGSDIFRSESEAPSRPPSTTEDAPPLVVAEDSMMGSESVLSAVFGEESILEPEFAPDDPLVGSDSTDSQGPVAEAAESSSGAIEHLGPQPPEVEPAKTEAPRKSQLSRVFGERAVSEKPLDEVVMEYLVDNARKRKRQPK